MVYTRRSNADKHPGKPVLDAMVKRRTPQEMAEARRLEEEAKQKAVVKKAVMDAHVQTVLDKLRRQDEQGASQGFPRPPTIHRMTHRPSAPATIQATSQPGRSAVNDVANSDVELETPVATKASRQPRTPAANPSGIPCPVD